MPQALRVLFSFQTEAIAPFITYDAYFGFVLQVVLALGISFELPLVMIILLLAGRGRAGRSSTGSAATPIVLACVAGAVLSPGADLLSMIMMTVPLLLLYEVGVAGSAIVHRRRAEGPHRRLVLLALGSRARDWPRNRSAPAGRRGLAARADTLETRPEGEGDQSPGRQSLDSATARRLGLPTAPSRSFAQPDSVVNALLNRQGYRPTRYRADSATVFVESQEVRLQGQALTERQGLTLEADSITYRRDSCLLAASGDPHLFDEGQVLVGEGISYDVCRRRGVIRDALTNFNEGSTVWFLRGNVARTPARAGSTPGRARSPAATCPRPTITSPPGR